MGANFVSIKMRGDLNPGEMRRDFELMQDQDRYENGHSYSGGIGMARGLKILSYPNFINDKDAENWLVEHCEKWEEAKAVQIKDKDGMVGHYIIGAWCSS